MNYCYYLLLQYSIIRLDLVFIFFKNDLVHTLHCGSSLLYHCGSSLGQFPSPSFQYQTLDIFMHHLYEK